MATTQVPSAPGNQPRRIDVEEIRRFIESLPRITEDEIKALEDKEASCPICMTTFHALIAEEEMAEAMGSAATPVALLGVTKLKQSWQCGHMFCRRDLSKWVNTGYRTCPLCRGPLYDPATETPDPVPAPSAPSLPLPESIMSVINFLSLTNRTSSSNNSGSSSSTNTNTPPPPSNHIPYTSFAASRNAALTQRPEGDMLDALLRLEQLQRQADEFSSFAPAVDTNRRRRTQDPQNRTLHYEYDSDDGHAGAGSSGMYS